ncbi:MAG: Killer protein [Acidobacteriia bacterium]|nr:Killer protein [Terriglobia bacterium]
MITSFRHRGLKALYESRTARWVTPEHVGKLRDILAVLDQSSGPEGMNLPAFRLHALRGPLKGHYAVWVSGNWRVTFRFEDGVAVDVDYVDYH